MKKIKTSTGEKKITKKYITQVMTDHLSDYEQNSRKLPNQPSDETRLKVVIVRLAEIATAFTLKMKKGVAVRDGKAELDFVAKKIEDADSLPALESFLEKCFGY